MAFLQEETDTSVRTRAEGRRLCPLRLDVNGPCILSSRRSRHVRHQAWLGTNAGSSYACSVADLQRDDELGLSSSEQAQSEQALRAIEQEL